MVLEMLFALASAWFVDGEDVVSTERWAGHQVVRGVKKVPFLGDLETRTDTFILADVTNRADGSVELMQKACKVSFKKVAGVRVSVDGPAMPKNKVVFEPVDGVFKSRSVVKWGSQDIDGDGHPGATVEVDASICSGALYVTNKATTNALAKRSRAGTLTGTVFVRVLQEVLDAEGRCLKKSAKDIDESYRGKFSYTKVDADATCSELLPNWPVKVR